MRIVEALNSSSFSINYSVYACNYSLWKELFTPDSNSLLNLALHSVPIILRKSNKPSRASLMCFYLGVLSV